MIQNVNVIALAQAAALVVGEEKAQTIAQMYRVIDDAMYAGYDMGLQDGQAKNEAAFDNGYENGYVDGVGDARARPAFADAAVQSIIENEMQLADDEYDLFDGDPKINAAVEGADFDFDAFGCGDPYCFICGTPEYDEDLVQDSGDAQG